MKKTNAIISLLLLVSLPSLAMGSRKPKYDYPDDLSDMCHGEKNAAEACIEDVGLDIRFRNRLKLHKHAGEKKFGAWWCWQSPEWNGMWVCGLTYDRGDYYDVHVGVNPNTQGEVAPEVVRHEHGHYWLMSNHNITNHDGRFGRCFANWNDPRHLQRILSNGERVIVDYFLDSDRR